jgi:hypothetical protein
MYKNNMFLSVTHFGGFIISIKVEKLTVWVKPGPSGSIVMGCRIIFGLSITSFPLAHYFDALLAIACFYTSDTDTAGMSVSVWHTRGKE